MGRLIGRKHEQEEAVRLAKLPHQEKTVKVFEEAFMGTKDSVQKELLDLARDEEIQVHYRLEVYRLYLQSGSPSVKQYAPVSACGK